MYNNEVLKDLFNHFMCSFNYRINFNLSIGPQCQCCPPFYHCNPKRRMVTGLHHTQTQVHQQGSTLRSVYLQDTSRN